MFDIPSHRSGYESPQDCQAEAVALTAWALFHEADEILTDDWEASEQTAVVMGSAVKMTQARKEAMS